MFLLIKEAHYVVLILIRVVTFIKIITSAFPALNCGYEWQEWNNSVVIFTPRLFHYIEIVDDLQCLSNQIFLQVF